MNSVLELVAFVLNSVLLLLEGASDLKFKRVPILLVGIHGLLVGVFTVTRLIMLGFSVLQLSYAALAITAIALLVLHVATGLIGGGDLLVVLASGLLSPHVAIGKLSGSGLVVPLAVLASASYLLYKYYSTTSVVYLKDLGKTRTRVRYATDLKASAIKDEVPVYIEGFGVVDRKLLRNPGELGKVLSDLPDGALVYTVPSYPYLYYYAASFIACYVCLTLISLALGVLA